MFRKTKVTMFCCGEITQEDALTSESSRGCGGQLGQGHHVSQTVGRVLTDLKTMMLQFKVIRYDLVQIVHIFQSSATTHRSSNVQFTMFRKI